jgi:GT2 family glycosyltransferase/glycosyltransferase involved in cell wall biosynthesis
MKLLVLVLFLGAFLVLNSYAQDLNSLKSDYLELVRSMSDVADGSREESVRNILNGLNFFQETEKQINLEWFKSSDAKALSGKKVCIVASSFEGITMNSGIGSFYASLAELLVHNGQKVTVVYTKDDESESYKGAVARLAAEGIEVVSLPHSQVQIDAPALIRKSYEVYQYLKTQEFDLVHFPEWEGVAYFTVLAKREGLAFANTKIVVGVHGPTHWVVSANSGKKELTNQGDLEVDFMERKSVELADFVWTPSEQLAQWALQKGWNVPSSASMLPLPAGKTVKALTAVSGVRKAKELVFFGRLEARKGLKLFCDALDQLAASEDLTVTFLGSQGLHTIEGLEAVDYIEQRAANWRFFWKVVVDTDRSDALQYLLESDERVAVIPSLTDNSPYTVYECLYLSIPFVASNIPSIAALVSGTENLFEPTVEALTAALNTAITNGVAPAKGVWTIASAEQAWTTYYNQVLSSSNVASAETATPKVTVCLVHFNRPTLLLQAIESIEQQDYTNVEVVLVDDGSNLPEAQSLLEHLEAPFSTRGWKIIKTSNKYLGAARNTAAKAATGKYLLFLDDDNYLKVNALSTYVSIAERIQADLLTAAHSVFEGVEPPSEATVAERIWIPLGSSVAVGLFRNCFGDANFFVSRESFLANPFTEEQNVGFEDYEFHANAALNGWNSVVVPEALMWYRMHDDGQMIHATSSVMNRLRSLRPYAAKLNDVNTVMRFLASGEVVARAQTCGDGICNVTGGENCANCYADCNTVCRCPGDPQSRCSNNGACRVTVDNGRTKAYCVCRTGFLCYDCRLQLSSNKGDVQMATIEKETVDSVVTFDMKYASTNFKMAVTANTFRGPVNVCFQEVTETGTSFLPPGCVVNPVSVRPKFQALPVLPGGGWYMDIADADTNIPQFDFNKPILLSWPSPTKSSHSFNFQKTVPFLYDEFSSQWALPAFTVANPKDVVVVRNAKSRTITFSVGSFGTCAAQFQVNILQPVEGDEFCMLSGELVLAGPRRSSRK